MSILGLKQTVSRPYRGYVFVAAESVKTARALNHWLNLALAFNRQTVDTRKLTSRPSVRNGTQSANRRSTA